MRDPNVHPAIASEIDRLDEAVDKARAAFEAADDLAVLARAISNAALVGPKIATGAAVEVVQVQLGAARLVLQATRLRLLARLAVVRLSTPAVIDAVALPSAGEGSNNGGMAASARLKKT